MSRILILIFALAFAGCASPRYDYRYVPGKTATLSDGYAVAPQDAPPKVLDAIAAGNSIAGLPYRYGGGHGASPDTGYDCSGAASHILMAAGLLDSPMPSKAFRKYGKSGEGEWISIYARKGHVFMSVAGLRFDTGWTRGPKGPQWTTESRPANGSVLRHPAGL